MKKVSLVVMGLIIAFGCSQQQDECARPREAYQFYTDKTSYTAGEVITLKCGYYDLNFSKIPVEYILKEDNRQFLKTTDITSMGNFVIINYITNYTTGEVSSVKTSARCIVSKSEIKIDLPKELFDINPPEFTITLDFDYLEPNTSAYSSTHILGYQETLSIKLLN